MHSVIIMNKKTTELFSQYSPLFMNALESNEISVCKWLESGTTVETAVPELYEAIGEYEKWRAVIVHLENDGEMSNFPAESKNPFDFSKCFGAEGSSYEKSSVPLIRLSQMLGGVPHPEVIFEKKPVKDRSRRSVYVPRTEESEKQRYDDLSKRYYLDAPAPEEIILVSVRKGFDGDDYRRAALLSGRELDPDTDFVVRNGYPVCCRFISFDMNRKGKTGSLNDMFRFWTTVLLVAKNEMNRGALQAYYLYKADVEIDRDALRCALQSAAGDVLYCRGELERRISEKRAGTKSSAESVIGPGYSMSITVPITPSDTVGDIPGNMYSAATGDRSADIGNWINASESIREGFRLMERNNDRLLDRTAMGVSGTCDYDEAEVYPLNRYQLEDMNERMEADRMEICTLSDELSFGKQSIAKRMKTISDRIKTSLRIRVSGRQVTWIILAAIWATLLCCIVPALILNAGGEKSIAPGVLTTTMILIALVGALTFLVVLVQHGALKRLITSYNICIYERIAGMRNSAEQYSRYLSLIAGHMHGSSFLDTLKKKNRKADNEFVKLHAHREGLDEFENSLRLWAKAFYLNIDFNKKNKYSTYFNVDTPPERNPVYSVGEDTGSEIVIGGSGETIISPVAFASGLSLKQEELYYDAGSNK